MNLRTLLEIARETVFLLRRGPVFIPAIIFTIIVGSFASIASLWGVVEFRKILFDVGGFGFHLIGNMIAIIWSTKILATARLDGSLEIQLASPVHRSTWLFGRFLGIFASLMLMGFIMLVIWQIIMLITDFGFLRWEEFSSLVLQILGWGVVAAIALFFSTFCGLITALFSSFSLWISGLLTELIVLTLHKDLGPEFTSFFKALNYVWNLQNFNRTPSYILEHGFASVGWALLYGCFLIAFFLVSGSLTFKQSLE